MKNWEKYFIEIKLYFGTFLIALEIIWMFWYISLNAVTDVKTKNGPDSKDLRSDLFANGIHVGVILAIILVISNIKRHIHFYILFIFLFACARDIFSIINTLRDKSGKEHYPELYNALISIEIYQLILSTTAFIWCVVLIMINPIKTSILHQDKKDLEKHSTKSKIDI